VIAYAKTVLIEPNVNMSKVYNITVEGAETYYANNILVHNCDVVSMTMARFRKGGFISTTLDKQDEPEEFRGRSYGRSAYY
jgi:type IV secretory pathway VirB9-like protein